MALGVALSEILIADDPIAVIGKQHVDRTLRQQTGAPPASKKPCCRSATESIPHPLKSVELQGNAREQGGRTRRFSYRTFSVVSAGKATGWMGTILLGRCGVTCAARVA